MKFKFLTLVLLVTTLAPNVNACGCGVTPSKTKTKAEPVASVEVTAETPKEESKVAEDKKEDLATLKAADETKEAATKDAKEDLKVGATDETLTLDMSSGATAKTKAAIQPKVVTEELDAVTIVLPANPEIEMPRSGSLAEIFDLEVIK